MHPSPPGAPRDLEDGLDPELVALHAPPQGQRLMALTVMAAAVVAALALMLSLRSDLRYALADAQPTDLGRADQVDISHLVPNSYVRIEGLPTLARAVRFSRGPGSSYRVFALAGQRQIYVQVADGDSATFARSEYTGRLVTFGDLGGRYAELSRYLRSDLHLPVTQESFLILADEPPRSYSWAWLVGLICLGFVLLDVYFIVRWFKPVRWLATSNKL